MKYLKSCLPKGNLLDTTILLISKSSIKIEHLYQKNLYSSILVSSDFIIFYAVLYTVLIFLIIFLIEIYRFKIDFLIQMFLIIIKRHFFSFYNIFFYIQQGSVFHPLRNVCNVHNNIVAYFLFLF